MTSESLLGTLVVLTEPVKYGAPRGAARRPIALLSASCLRRAVIRRYGSLCQVVEDLLSFKGFGLIGVSCKGCETRFERTVNPRVVGSSPTPGAIAESPVGVGGSGRYRSVFREAISGRGARIGRDISRRGRGRFQVLGYRTTDADALNYRAWRIEVPGIAGYGRLGSSRL